MNAVLVGLGVGLLLGLSTMVLLMFEKEYRALASMLARLLVLLAGWCHPTRRMEWLADVLYLQSRDRSGLWEATAYLGGAPWLSLRQVDIRIGSGQAVWHKANCGGALIFGLVHILAAALSVTLIQKLAAGPDSGRLSWLTSVLVLGLAIGLAVAVGRRLPSLAAALTTGPVLGLPIGLAFWPVLGPNFALRVGVAVMLALVLAYVLSDRLGAGVIYALGLGLDYGLGGAFADGWPAGLDLVLLDMSSILAAALGAGLSAALTSRLATSRGAALGAVLSGGLLFGLVFTLAENATITLSNMVVYTGDVLALALGFGLTGGLVIGLTGSTSQYQSA